MIVRGLLTRTALAVSGGLNSATHAKSLQGSITFFEGVSIPVGEAASFPLDCRSWQLRPRSSVL